MFANIVISQHTDKSSHKKSVFYDSAETWYYYQYLFSVDDLVRWYDSSSIVLYSLNLTIKTIDSGKDDKT